MIINFSADSIVLSNFQLSSYHLKQLLFWNFKHNFDKKLLSIDLREGNKIFTKLISYLEKEGIDYQLSKEGKNLLEKMNLTKENFVSKKSLLNKFKNGEYDKKQYTDFKMFLTKNIPRKLKEHQSKAAFHLYLARNGANFSVPGSGKTSVVLSVYEKLRSEGVVNTLIVVGPPASFGPWKHEFEKTLGRIPCYEILAGGNKKQRKLQYYPSEENKKELYLTSFQTLLQDEIDIKNLLRLEHIKAFLVIDEAHYIKQVEGNWARTVLNIGKDSVVRCILTGTPIPKSYADIFNLFEFLWPDNKLIEEKIKYKILNLEKYNEVEKVKNILEDTIGPFFYRVRKKELLLTEPVFHDPIVIPMNKYERLIYDAIENKIRLNTNYDNFNDIELVLKLRKGRLIRLRQVVSYISLLKSSIEGYSELLYDPKSDIAKYINSYDLYEVPAKLEFLIKMLKNIKNKGEKVVIWSNFVGTLEFLKEKLNTSGFYSKLIYGKTPIHETLLSVEEDREKIRNEFVHPQSGLDILIANPAACAESISLHTTCHNAIYYDLTYNCAQYLQSLDRIHRVGGSEDKYAHYYFLQYAQTFENDIKQNLDQKALKMYQLIDQDYAIYNLDMFEDEEISAYDRLFQKDNRLR